MEEDGLGLYPPDPDPELEPECGTRYDTCRGRRLSKKMHPCRDWAAKAA